MTIERRELTVEQAQRLLAVSSPNTIRNFIERGWLPAGSAGGVLLIEADSLVRAKVLAEKNVLTHPEALEAGIEQADLARAIEGGLVAFHAWPAESAEKKPRRRLSLEDLRAIIALKNGKVQLPAAGAQGAGTTGSQDTANAPRDADSPGSAPRGYRPAGRADFWQHLTAYVIGHGDPCKIPPQFWDTRTCPEFEPPAGVHRYTYADIFMERDDDSDGDPAFTMVSRSAGWAADGNGGFIPVPSDPEFATEAGAFEYGKPAATFAHENLRYRHVKAAWEEAWYRRRKELRAAGADISAFADQYSAERRDRRAILKQYIEEGWSPCDLPDWFWDTAECPPFEPPLGVGRVRWGEPGRGEGGRVITWIHADASWQRPLGDELEYVAEDPRSTFVVGEFHAGDPLPMSFDLANKTYAHAEQEWREEYRLRRRRRDGI